MCTNKLLLFALIVCVSFSAGCREAQPGAEMREVVQPEPADTSASGLDFAALQGEWIMVGGDGAESEESVVIDDARSYQWKTPNGMQVSVDFDTSPSPESSVVSLMYANSEDAEEVGGGGPRKGIARRAPSGDVEIIVARSAGHDYPEADSEIRPEFSLRKK